MPAVLAWQKCRGKSWRDARPPGDCVVDPRSGQNETELITCLVTDLNQVSFLLICWVWITRGWRCQGEALAARCIWSVRMYNWTRITTISAGWYMLVRQFRYTCENEYVIYLFVIFLFLTECVCIFRFSDIIIFTPISHCSEIHSKI